METSIRQKMMHALRLEYADVQQPWLNKQDDLRKCVGILGVLLPVLLLFYLLLFCGYHKPLSSISHYYYTQAGTVFSVIVSLLGIFLLIYKGYEAIDFFVSSLAGIFALCVILFPTSNLSELCCDVSKPYAITYLKASSFRAGFHYFSATIFLSALAYMSYFLFTKSDKPMDQWPVQKRKRNLVYKICGVVMALAMSVIGLGQAGIIHQEFYEKHTLTFWMESCAIWAFGISWLVKGGVMFADAEQKRE
jgi:membrane-associated HD superfamily phosphohydrolase